MTRLTYRGIEYELHTNQIDEIPSHQLGKYRGQYWRKNVLKMIPIDSRDIDLQYRGLRYHLGVKKSPLTQLTQQVDACASHQHGNKVNCMHLSNIRRNIEHRLEVAKSKGDDALVRILIDEARQVC